MLPTTLFPRMTLFLGVLASVAASGCSLRPSRADRTDGAEGLHAARRLEAQDDALFTRADEVLVHVNGRPLTRREFIARVVRQLGSMTLLSEVVKEELFLQEAERLGIEVGEDDIQKEVEAVLDGMSREIGQGDTIVGRERLADLYERQGLSLQDVRRDLDRRARNQLVISGVVRAARRVDDGTLSEYYEQNRRYFARHIAYRFPSTADEPTREQREKKKAARAKALRAIELIQSGKARFEALAMAESDDELTRAFGGKLGPVTAEAPMPAELKAAIFSLGEGEISQPIENPKGGFHVFQVTRIQPRESFEQIKDRLREEYLAREPDLAEIREVFYALREKAQIRWQARTTTPARAGGSEER